MTELFESTIENVSDMEVKVYADPVENTHNLEIWAKTGEEEYIYKFTGPGVKMANPLNPMVNDCLKLSKEIEKLTFEKMMSKKENKVVEQEPNTREDILDQAKKCVCGQREQDYGTPESNFQLIADLWNGYLGFMDHSQDQIRATDVAMMMALLKIARIRNGGGSGDSFVDLAGYAACGGEIYYGERHSNT